MKVYRNEPSSIVEGSHNGAESVNIRSCVDDSELSLGDSMIFMRAFGAGENIASSNPLFRSSLPLRVRAAKVSEGFLPSRSL